MTDPIDPDAPKPSDLRAWLTFHDLAGAVARRVALALLDDRETLRDEVDRLRAREVPDSHTRMPDGKLYRLVEESTEWDDDEGSPTVGEWVTAYRLVSVEDTND